MSDFKFNAVVLEPKQKATATVIWLHGLGANGHDFEPIVPMFPEEVKNHVRFVFPHAPQRPVSINMNMVMPAWYDISDPNLDVKQDEEGVRASEALLRQYIAHEVAQGIPESRIILAGFSQGGAIALQTGLRYPEPLAGIMALSTYVPLMATVEAERNLANANTEIFMGHGQHDPVVAYSLGQQSQHILEALNYKVVWHGYMMEHNVIPNEINDIGRWLKKKLPALQVDECK